MASKRQSTISGCSSSVDPSANQEQQTQITADAMRQHLLSIGESCIVAASQLTAWALKTDAVDMSSDETNEAVAMADQVSYSTNFYH